MQDVVQLSKAEKGMEIRQIVFDLFPKGFTEERIARQMDCSLYLLIEILRENEHVVSEAALNLMLQSLRNFQIVHA